MAATLGTKVGAGYVSIEPDFSRFQEKVGRQLNQALAPVMRKAGGNAGREISRGIDRGGFGQALIRRFGKVGDDAGKELAAKVSKGAKRAEGDMFGLADAVREVEKRSRKASGAAKGLEHDMFGIHRQARASGKQIKSVSAQLDDFHARSGKAEAGSRRLGARIRGLGYEFGSLRKGIRTSSGGFSGFDGVMARVNRGSQFFRNIIRTIRWPVFIAGLGLSVQGLSALVSGALAATGALSSLSGVAIALPAALLAGAQAMGAFKLATAGVADAVKAALDVEVSSGGQAVDVMRQQRDAAERVADAKRNLIDVQERARSAQDDLTEARESATRQLHDMRRAAKETGLTEKEASLSLREARRELAKTLRDPESTGLDVQGAELAVQRARNELQNTRVEAQRVRKDYRDAEKGGVKQMPEVVAATEAAEDAKQAAADAERDYKRAVEDATEAMKDQGAAASALQDKMSQLPPAAQKFVRLLVSMKPRLDALRATAADGFFPGAEKGLKGAMRNFGVFRGIIGGTSKVLGGLAAKAGQKLGTDVWGRDLSRLGKLNTRIIDRMGDSALNLADGFRHILVSAEPFLDWLSEGTEAFSEWVKTESAASRENGKLAEFFDRTRETMERVWPILKGVGGALGNIAKAARPLGNEILDSLGDAAEGWRKWTDSTKGQNRLKTFFTETKPAIFEMGWLIRDAGKAFFELGRQRGVAELLRLVRTELIPAMRDLVGGTTGWAAKFLGEFGELREQGVPAFDALIQTLVDHAVEAGIKMAKALVNAFFNSGPLGKLFIGGWLLTKFGGGGAIAKIGALIGRQLGFGIGDGAGAGLETAAKGPLRSRLLSVGKTLGIAFAAYGFFEGARTALSESKGAKGLTDGLHNAGVGFFRAFGLSVGETTAEEFSKGFQRRVTSLAGSGFVGKQTIISPKLEGQAFEEAREITGAESFGGDAFQEQWDRSLAGLLSSVKARRASAKELFQGFWDDMAPDEKVFARKLRAGLIQGDRLLRATGVKLPPIKLETNPQGTAKGVRKILSDFSFLRKGVGTSVKDINRVSGRAGKLIVQTFGRGSEEARKLTAQNMRLTAQAYANQMTRSGNFTKEGLERIKRLIRNADLLSPTRKQAEGFGREWSKGMDHTKEVTAKGINAMIREARKMPGPMRKVALETWLDQAKQARRSGDLSVDAFRSMRSRIFSEFGTFRASGKAFNKEFAKGFVDMANESGGAIGILMDNLSSALSVLGEKGAFNFTVKKATGGGGGKEQKRQTGGFIVPGSGSGDTFRTALPAGSFIENREAVRRLPFQAGGLMPVALEPGERAYMPSEVKKYGQRNLEARNSAVPRFQRGGTVGRFQGGGIVPVPGFPGEQINSRVLNTALSFMDRFKLFLTDAYGPGHQSPEHTQYGTAIDVVPGPGGSWDMVGQAVASAVKAGYNPVYYDGSHGSINLPPHGPGHHAHITLLTVAELLGGANLAGFSGGAGGALQKLKNQILDGPDGPLKTLGQAAINKVHQTGQRFLQGRQGAMEGARTHSSRGDLEATGNGAGLMKKLSAQRGWNFADWWELDRRETGHGSDTYNESSGASLRAQFLPMNFGSYGPGSDPAQNPSMGEQIMSMAQYIAERYGNPSAALAHHDANNWYQRGGLLKLQKGGLLRRFLGSIPGFQSGGAFKGNINRTWPGAILQTEAGKWGALPTLPSYVLAALAEAAGDYTGTNMPGWTMAQMTKGEGGGKPGSMGDDNGDGKPDGYGWLAITRPHGDTFGVTKLGGYEEMLNPVKNAYVAARMFGARGLAPWYGDSHVTNTNAHYDGKYDLRDALGGATFEQALKGEAPSGDGADKAKANPIPDKASFKTKGGATGAGGGTAAPAEGEVPTALPSFGPLPTTVKAVRAELTQRQGEMWEHRQALRAAKAKKQGRVVKALEANIGKLKGRIRKLRRQLMVLTVKNRIEARGTLPKTEASVDAARTNYEDLVETAEQTLGLEPEEAPDAAAYISNVETPAWEGAWGALGGWRNAVLGGQEAAVLRLGKLQAQIDAIRALKEKHPKAWKKHKFKIPLLQKAMTGIRGIFNPGPPPPPSGTLEESLTEVQGPDKERVRGPLPTDLVPGRFGGLVWDTQIQLRDLGIKLKQATESAAGETDTERSSLLEELLRQANQRTLASETSFGVFRDFEKTYAVRDLPEFHGGGVAPGPANREVIAKLRGQETIFTPEQTAALGAGLSTSGAGGDLVIENLEVLINEEDDTATVRYGDRQFETEVRRVVGGMPTRLLPN